MIFSLNLIVSGQQKDKVAILTLKNSNGVSIGEAEIISDRLRNDFFTTGRVDVMERDQMQNILKEQGLQQSGLCTDEGCMVELGKMLGVKRLIAGSIGKLGSMYLLNVRSIDVSSGKIDCAVTDDIKGDIEDVVQVLSSVASRVASQNCSNDDEQSYKQVVLKTSTVEKEVSSQEPSSSSDESSLPCEGEIYLEKTKFDPSILGFKLEDDDIDDVDGDLADAFEEALDRDVVLASTSQLQKVNCSTKVLRCTIVSYQTDGAARDQITGTLKLSISVFESPLAKTPLTSIVIEKEGDRDWGQTKPFLNAIDETLEIIEDDFDSAVKKYFK
jgi:TolB-like protein